MTLQNQFKEQINGKRNSRWMSNFLWAQRGEAVAELIHDRDGVVYAEISADEACMKEPFLVRILVPHSFRDREMHVPTIRTKDLTHAISAAEMLLLKSGIHQSIIDEWNKKEADRRRKTIMKRIEARKRAADNEREKLQENALKQFSEVFEGGQRAPLDQPVLSNEDTKKRIRNGMKLYKSGARVVGYEGYTEEAQHYLRDYIATLKAIDNSSPENDEIIITHTRSNGEYVEKPWLIDQVLTINGETPNVVNNDKTSYGDGYEITPEDVKNIKETHADQFVKLTNVYVNSPISEDVKEAIFKFYGDHEKLLKWNQQL